MVQYVLDLKKFDVFTSDENVFSKNVIGFCVNIKLPKYQMPESTYTLFYRIIYVCGAEQRSIKNVLLSLGI